MFFWNYGSQYGWWWRIRLSWRLVIWCGFYQETDKHQSILCSFMYLSVVLIHQIGGIFDQKPWGYHEESLQEGDLPGNLNHQPAGDLAWSCRYVHHKARSFGFWTSSEFVMIMFSPICPLKSPMGLLKRMRGFADLAPRCRHQIRVTGERHPLFGRTLW